MSETATTSTTTDSTHTSTTTPESQTQTTAPTTTPAAAPDSQAPTPTPAAPEVQPTPPSNADDLRAQLDALHGELQLWKLKSSMKGILFHRTSILYQDWYWNW